MQRIYICLFFILSISGFHAQDLKGKWIEEIHDDGINGYAEINVESQEGDQLSGYNFDVTIVKPSRYDEYVIVEAGRCSHKFSALYDANRGVVRLREGSKFFETPNHSGGDMVLEYYEKEGKQYLEGIYGGRTFNSVRNKVRYVKVPEDYVSEDPIERRIKYGPPNPKDYANTYNMRTKEFEPFNGYYYNDDFVNPKSLDTNMYQDPDDYFSENQPKDENTYREDALPTDDMYSTHTPNINEDIPKRDPNQYFSEEELEKEENDLLAQNTEEPSTTEDDFSEPSEIVEIAEEVDAPTNISNPPVEIEESTPFTSEEVDTPAEVAENTSEVEEVPESVEVEEMKEIAQVDENGEPLPNYEPTPLTQEEKDEVAEMLKARNTKTLANIRTQDKSMKIVVKDYGEQDGDEISIIVDGRVLYRRLKITSLQKVMEIVLASDKKRNEITFVAENLGRVPPNTARIELFLNGKKYSYSLLTDTQTNAKIVLLRE